MTPVSSMLIANAASLLNESDADPGAVDTGIEVSSTAPAFPGAARHINCPDVQIVHWKRRAMCLIGVVISVPDDCNGPDDVRQGDYVLAITKEFGYRGCHFARRADVTA